MQVLFKCYANNFLLFCYSVPLKNGKSSLSDGDEDDDDDDNIPLAGLNIVKNAANLLKNKRGKSKNSLLTVNGVKTRLSSGHVNDSGEQGLLKESISNSDADDLSKDGSHYPCVKLEENISNGYHYTDEKASCDDDFKNKQVSDIVSTNILRNLRKRPYQSQVITLFYSISIVLSKLFSNYIISSSNSLYCYLIVLCMLVWISIKAVGV